MNKLVRHGTALLSATLLVLAACAEQGDGPAGPQIATPGPETSAPDGPLAERAVTPAAEPADVGPMDVDPSLWVAPTEGQLALAGHDKIVVDDDKAECPDADFMTIQDAVDEADAQPGENEIEICPGTYPEDVVIGPNNPLKITGDGVGSTVITGVPGSSDDIINIVMADKVEIEKLTVDGLSDRSGGYGIRYYDTDGKVKDVEVKNIRSAGGGSGRGIGILAGAGGPAGADVKIENSLIENYTRVGILVNGEGAKADIKDTRVVGPVEPRGGAPNGIQVSRQAEAKVEKNFIDNNPSPNPPGGAGSGIILFCAGKTDVKDNHITDADLGISLADQRDAKIEKNVIEGGDFDGISLQFLGLFFGDIGCSSAGNPLPTRDNDIKDNTIRDVADDGISLANFDEGTEPTNPFDNKIEKNRFVRVGDRGISQSDGSGNEFKNNRIEEPGTFGIVNFSGPDNVFEKNEITDSGDAGIAIVGSGNVIEKNEITRPGAEGIGAYGSGNLFEDNKIDDPTSWGLNLTEGSGPNTFEKNDVYGAGSHGVRIFRSDGNTLADNKVEMSAGMGIRVQASDDNTLDKNDVKESGSTGLFFLNARSNTVTDNKVDKSGGDGIEVSSQSFDNVFEKNDVKKSTDLSCEDLSTGDGTAGTDNKWDDNKGDGPSSPPAICNK